MSEGLAILCWTAASIGVIHALLGPDHYLPFIAMAKARSWSLRRTLGITLACGIGHVLGSVILGGVGILLGWAARDLDWLQGVKGEAAAWLLIGFGVAYAAWGLRRAYRARPHSHWHAHADGTVHQHTHSHQDAHVHVHDHKPSVEGLNALGVTPWALFVVFLLGPCEPLIPLLMVPAAGGSWWGVTLVVLVFAVSTVGTMLGVVTLGQLGLSRLIHLPLERYAHTAAGLTLVACGLLIHLGV